MTSQLIVRLDADKKRKIAEKAKAAGVSMQVVFSYLADAWLDNKLELGMNPVYRDDVYTKEDHQAFLQ